MRHRQARGGPVPWPDLQRQPDALADPIASAKAIGDVLPQAIEQAEAAGLSLIAQHLAKALQLARGIAASGTG